MRTIYSNYARSLTALMLLALAALLSSCGGSGAPSTSTSTTTTSTAAKIQLLVSSAQMPSAGGSTVDVTAIVLSATGQALSGQVVTFSTNNDPTAYFSNVGATSDASGIVTAKLNLGADKDNRIITITATSGTAVGTNTVTVTGTSISISGNNSLTLGASTQLTFSVKDSSGAAIPGSTVTLTSAAGNQISPATGTTDPNGQLVATVTATKTATSDTITATAAGATKTQSLTINSSSFAFTAPTANALIPINTAQPISLLWTNGGTPVASSTVNFSASRGTITGAAATTNASGIATASISSNTTGPTILSAAGTGGSPATSVNITFYTNTASTISLQANPSTVQVTTGTTGQTSNSSVVSVVVRDAANNLVQNAQVNFSLTTDVSGGHLSSSTAITDAYGTASVTYIAGGVSSPQNGVVITAQVININGTIPVTGVSGTVSLTVSGQSLLVRLGTDNLVNSTPPMNSKKYAAVVTDAAGNAVAGATVYFKLRANKYFKGVYVKGATAWVQALSVAGGCASEDNGGGLDPSLANNGILDSNILGTTVTEDVNGNGNLDPGNATATITPSGVTDATGVAYATVTYTKDHATWAEMIIEARTTVNSNDPPATAVFDMRGLASDYSDLTVAPPGQISPYGTATLCTDPN